MRTKVVATAELTLAALIVLGHNVWHVVPNEVLVLLVIGGISLWCRGLGPRSIGFVRPRSWPRTFLGAGAVAAGLQVAGLFVVDPLLQRLFHRGADLSAFRPLVGNVRLTLIALVLVWTFAAFGEELVYRGYLMNRAADLGGRSWWRWTFSLVFVAVLFGLAHFYKGLPGMLDSGLSALVLGGVYLGSNRNLWFPILTHGLIDTLGLLLVFFELVPV